MSVRKLRLSPYPSKGSITIAAGDVLPIARGGNFVRVRAADQPFTLRFDDGSEISGSTLNDIYKLESGDSFKKLEVINDSGFPLTFQLDIGYGDISTNSVSINGDLSIKNANAPNNVLNTVERAGASHNSPVDPSLAATATNIILAANTNRKHVLISNLSGSGVFLRIGDVNATANRGLELAAGATLSLESEGAIYGYNPSAGAISVGILEVEKV